MASLAQVARQMSGGSDLRLRPPRPHLYAPLIRGPSVPDRLTLVAFATLVAIGGANSVAVRAGSAELPPFWGAFVRFALASLLLFGVVAARRLPLPRGRALVGAMLFGVLGFAASYALFYWGIVEVEAGLAQVLMSLIPLFTLLLAVLHRVERLRMRALAGTLLAMAGVAIVSAEQITLAVPLIALLAIVGSAACAAEAGVLVKAFPSTNIVTFNAVAMAGGAALLLGLSVLTNERPALPQAMATWLSLAYLVPIGSIAIFLLYLFVLQRWTASATSYLFVLAPFVTVAVGVLFAGERLSLPLILGAGLVLLGVIVGALWATARPAPTVAPPSSVRA